ncbi:MAG: DUF3298 domain-containing protein [Candidatus Pacebacteria bacterium]|jgi:hypothetical protein|nr:DUF3298 domain-containing protein [Candidatus Paceibacterota bacterium]
MQPELPTKTYRLQIFLLALIIIGLGLIFTRHVWVPRLVNELLTDEEIKANDPAPAQPISISSKDIKETNFIGKMSVLSGDGNLVAESNKYIAKTISEFKKQADEQVPDLRKKFGMDNPTANYTIDISAKLVEGHLTKAMVLTVYTFTGGAHGSSYYKVFNVFTTSDKIITLSDTIKNEKHTEFTNLVKKELKNWKPDGYSVVFPETVDGLFFASFKSWSLDKENLVLYFDQYEVGPGSLGAFPFPIPLKKLPDFF